VQLLFLPWLTKFLLFVVLSFLVSSAIGRFGESPEKRVEWVAAVDTIFTIVANILKHPGDTKYYNINMMNPNFHQKYVPSVTNVVRVRSSIILSVLTNGFLTQCYRVGRLPGTIDILRSLGFAETEGGSLVMPLEMDLHELQARKLEIETGLALLKERVEADQKEAHDKDIHDRLKANEAAASAQKSGTTGKSGTSKRGGKDSKATTQPVAPNPTAGTSPSAAAGEGGDATASGKRDVLQAEKMKRIKAEVALQQHKAAMQELQAQLFDLKEAEHRQLTWRYEATINRLPVEEKQRITQQVSALGKDPEAFKKLAETQVSPTKKGKDAGKEMPELTTALTRAATAGETRLSVASQDGFKKGMKLLIGSGTSMEVRTLAGFGSLIVDKPLTFTHAAGTTVVGVIPSSKNLLKLEKRNAREYCLGLLYEEIIPAAVTAGEKTAIAQQLNRLYFQRPVMKHVYTVHKLPAVKLGDAPCASVALAGDACKLLAAVGGRLEAMDFRLCAVDFIVLFSSLARTVAAVKDIAVSSKWIDSETVEVSELLEQIESSVALRGAFRLMADTRHASTIAELFTRAAGAAEGLISWSAYFAVVVGRPLKRSAELSIPLLGYTGGIDGLSFVFLLRLFDFLDCDGDECVADAEASRAFAELDGCLTGTSAFDDAVCAVAGGKHGDVKLSLKDFLRVREQYAKACDTLLAGMFLHGVCQVHVAVQTLAEQVRGGAVAEHTLSAYDVSRALPSTLLYKRHLPNKSTLALLLETDLTKRSVSELMDVVGCGRAFGGATARHTSCGSSSATIVQVLVDPTGTMAYALVDNGAVQVYDVLRGTKLFEQRVMWSEPMPARSVEGNEKFAKWRKDSGLEHDNNTPDMHLNSIECTRLSSLMARFALSLPMAAGSANALAVDPVTGLVAVNCSVVSGSICFFEPTSLKRIYRIKSPAKFTPEVTDAIHGLNFGKLPRMELFRKQNCAGALTAMAVDSRRSLLFCQIAEQHTLAVVSMLTGELLMELAGHTDAVSCFSTHAASDLLFTGSEDRSVRVWKTAECVPSFLAVSGAASDPGVKKLEHKVTHASTVGAGSTRLLRNLSTHLCARLRVQPRWRRAVVTSFFDSHAYATESPASQMLTAVEVVFENGTSHLFSNPTSLRDVREIERAPGGPPLWSERAAVPAVGLAVGVYEVDPELLAIALGRELGVHSAALLPYERVKTLLQSLFAPGMGLDVTNVSLSLEAVGYQTTDEISLRSFVQRLHKQQERYYALSDRVLHGNAAPILSVGFNAKSKLLFAIDKSGCCCVWDPCGVRTLLSVSDGSQSVSLCGPHPYALVSCHNLGAGMTFSGSIVPNVEFSSAVSTLPLTAVQGLPFPVDKTALARAYHVESTFSVMVEAPVVRGFIYVMKDFSFMFMDTACFLPDYVALQNGQLFMHSTNLLGRENVSNLQKIYRNRHSVLRVVYAVSSSHRDMATLCVDLSKYGVITRGYTTTPSDRIQVVCFERDADWYTRVQSASDLDVNAGVKLLQNSATSRSSGIVMGVQRDIHGRREYRIAANFSNEILAVAESSVHGAVGKTAGVNGEAAYSAVHGYALGALVEFTLDLKMAGDAAAPDSFGDLSAVVVRVTSETGESSSYLVPIALGRSSYPVAANRIDAPATESTKTTLSQAYAARMQAIVGRGQLAAFVHGITLAAWERSAQLQRNAVLSNWTAGAGTLVSSTQASAQLAFGQRAASFAHFLVQQAISLLQQRVATTHPFVTYLQDALGHVGEELVAAFHHRDDKAKNGDTPWSDFLDGYCGKWLRRKGVTIEEIHHCCASSAVTDVEVLAYRLQQLLNAARSHNKHSVGQVTVAALQVLLAPCGLGSAKSDAPVKVDSSGFVGAAFRANLLRLLLAQHQASLSLASVTRVAASIKDDAISILCAELDALMKPITIAVKHGQARRTTAAGAARRPIYREEKPPSGQYAVSSKARVESLFPGLVMEMYVASKSRSAAAPDSFLVWRFPVQESDVEGELVAAVAHIPHVISVASRNARVVRALDGISFEAEASAPCLVLEWNSHWRSLSSIVASTGGFLGQGKLELLRLIASNLLDAVSDLHSSGCMLKALNPHNIILEANGTDVLLVVLPTAGEANQEADIAARSAQVLQSYTQQMMSDPTAVSCLPCTDAQSARQADQHSAQWDSWSFGASLFIAAFGMCPFQFASDAAAAHTDTANNLAVTGTLLYQLLLPVLVRRNQPAGDDSKPVTGTFTDGAAISEALKSVLSEQTKSILFSMVRQYTEHTMDYLLTFRSKFIGESLTCGLTEWATGALWEKIVQCIFLRMRGGLHEVGKLRDKITALPKPLSEEASSKFLSEQLGVELSKPETDALVTSLTPAEMRDSPQVERVSKMYKALGVALEEIFHYGLFQQLLHIICACLSADPTSRPKLSELKDLAFFDIHNESATSKAAREAKLLMTPFQSSEEFFSRMLHLPLQQSLQRLVVASVSTVGSNAGVGAWKVKSDLLSSCVSRFEDLVTVATSEAVGKTVATLPASLSKTGADQAWLKANTLSILQQGLDLGFLPGVALFLQRFLGTDYAKNLDAERGSLTMRDTPNVRGISLGSKLAARISKFLQHLVNCMGTMSSALSVTQLAEGAAEHQSVLERLRRKQFLDALFNSTLTALQMLFSGEESTVAFTGAYHTSLQDAHPHLFVGVDANHEGGVLASSLTTDSRWNSQVCKLFESPLLDLVGEDGSGSSKVAVSLEAIKNADKLMNNFTSQFAMSFPNFSTQVAGHATPQLFKHAVQSRGSFYFVGLVRYVRGICVMEAASSKTNERSQQGVIQSVILLLPTPTVTTVKVLDSAEESGRVVPTARYYPEGQWWQKIQVVLDTRCGARLQANFSSSDVTTKLALLKLCQRALTVCLSLPGELMESEPFLTLGRDFTSAGWVHGISELLKTKATNPDLGVNAMVCLRLMAHRAGFMRAWPVFQVMPILCNVARHPGRDYAILRLEATATLKLAAMSCPLAVQALITLRVPNLDAVQGMTHVTPVANLLVDANDMSFGSTLEEQRRFSDELLEWVNGVFPAEVPHSVLAQHNFNSGDDHGWSLLFDIAAQVVSWVPKLCLALVVTDAQDAVRREKTQVSCNVALKQLQVVERILMYALSSGHPHAIACVARCLWAATSTLDDSHARSDAVRMALRLVESQTSGNGLLSCIDQLTSTGTYIDTFLSLRLQFAVMHILARLVKYGSVEVLQLMTSCGVVRSVDKFLQGAFAVMKDVPRLAQQGLFAKQYKDMVASLREAWGVLVGTRDSRVYEDILDLNLLQRLVQDWLPSTVSITFGNIDPEYNPLVMRVEALKMLQALVLHMPASERLVAEVARWVIVSDTVRKELNTLKSTSTKKGANAKRMAAEVMSTLAALGAEVVEQEMLVRGVCRFTALYMIVLIIDTCIFV
jgi:serine/threonine protein kinase/WD40 repeat protein